jgi:hypothetical protein
MSGNGKSWAESTESVLSRSPRLLRVVRIASRSTAAPQTQPPMATTIFTTQLTVIPHRDSPAKLFTHRRQQILAGSRNHQRSPDFPTALQPDSPARSGHPHGGRRLSFTHLPVPAAPEIPNQKHPCLPRASHRCTSPNRQLTTAHAPPRRTVSPSSVLSGGSAKKVRRGELTVVRARSAM